MIMLQTYVTVLVEKIEFPIMQHCYNIVLFIIVWYNLNLTRVHNNDVGSR